MTAPSPLMLGVLFFYLTTIFIHFYIFKSLQKSSKWYLSALFPIVILALVHIIDFLGVFASSTNIGIRSYFVLAGFSYTMFRLSLLTIESVGGRFEFPKLFHYLFYACFPPFLLVGPISSYGPFADWFAGKVQVTSQTLLDSLGRIAIGAVKYGVVSSILYHWTLTPLLDRPWEFTQLNIVAGALIYPTYLYFNFSGLIDMVIGVSGLMGISVDENFNRPLFATNIRDFWNRWHMTLTGFLQNTIFTPLVLRAARKDISINIAAPIATLLVFIAIGLWHGFTLSFLLFGLLNGLGLVVFYFIEPWTGWIPKPLAVLINYLFVAFCFVFFENSWGSIQFLLNNCLD